MKLNPLHGTVRLCGEDTKVEFGFYKSTVPKKRKGGGGIKQHEGIQF